MQLNWRSLVTLGLFAAFSWPLSALNPDYNFTIVALSGQTIDGLQLSPAFGFQACLNDSGEIAFINSYVIAPGVFGSGLFTPDHVIVKSGDQIDGQAIRSVASCALNDSGDLLFVAVGQSGTQTLFRRPAGLPPERVVGSPDKIDSLEIHQFNSIALSNLGKIVFSATYTGQGGISGLGIFTPDAALLHPGSVVDHHVLSSVDPLFALSDTELFFHAFTTTGVDAIFTTHSVIVRSGDSISGFRLVPVGTSAALSSPAASHLGHLAYGATFQNGSGIFTPQSIVAQTSGLLPPVAAINDSDDIVYFQNEPGVFGFFVNQNELILAGDAINGHVINGFTISQTINNRGFIIFNANFTDGSEGIVLATPKP